MAPGIEEALAHLHRYGARVEHRPRFLARAEADRFLRELMESVEFDSEEASSIRRPFSRERIPIPRRQTAYGEPGTTYAFSGTAVRARAWIPVLCELRHLLVERLSFESNFVLLNHYRSGADCIGWHSDDERDLGPAPEVVSLSLGATRDFQLRPKGRTVDDGRAPAITVTLPLAHGDLLVLRHPTNRDWKHQLPRRGGRHPERIGPRLNLTWRAIAAS